MTSVDNPWQVQLQGEGRDLEHLARCFTAPPRIVRRDEAGSGFVYECDAFAACTSAVAVLEAACRDFSVLSGVLRFARGSSEALRSGGVYRRNASGGRDAFLHVHDAVHAHVTDEIALTVVDSNGNVITAQNPSPRTVVLANLAFFDEAVEKAFRLTAQADSGSWVALYRLYEHIEADVGGQGFVTKRGWSTTRALRLFKHSANSVAVAGDAARHGKETGTPPRMPMSVAEATAFVAYIMEAWLAHKNGASAA